MRIRHKPWAKPELESCSFYVADPQKQIGHWRELFDEPESTVHKYAVLRHRIDEFIVYGKRVKPRVIALTEFKKVGESPYKKLRSGDRALLKFEPERFVVCLEMRITIFREFQTVFRDHDLKGLPLRCVKIQKRLVQIEQKIVMHAVIPFVIADFF